MAEDMVAGSPAERDRSAGRSNAQVSAKIGFWSGFVSIGLLILLHVLRPDLKPARSVFSEYSLGEFQALGRAWFLIMGIGTSAAVFALMGFVRGVAGKIGLIALAFGALGLLMASIYAMDPISTPPDQASFTGQMHGVAAMIGNPGFVLGAILLALAITRAQPFASDRGRIVGIALLCLIGFFAMGAAVMSAMATPPGWGAGAIGLVNRLLILAYSLWLVVALHPLVRDQDKAA